MMRWIVVLVIFLPLWADGMEEEVKRIIAKMERLQRTTISPSIDFTLYDPFRRVAPLIEKAKPVKKVVIPVHMPKLLAVMNDRAMIDGHWLRVGDNVDGYHLTAISASGVWLAKKGVRRFLPLTKRQGLLKLKDRDK